jgi:hypothetical protein
MATPPSHLHTILPDTARLKLKSVEYPDGGQVLIMAAVRSSTAD